MHRLLPDNPEITELVVLSRWTSKEHQKNWVKSQSFKQMHQKNPQIMLQVKRNAQESFPARLLNMRY
ncbi:antibiotic biosynthesis monooxygenase [Enterococcus termitis]